MRSLARAVPVILLACGACDKDERAKELAASVAGDAGPVMPTSPAPLDASPPDAGAAEADAGSLTMPERPIPRPQTTVGSGMPTDVQMKAIAYMVAMRSPRPGEANADPEYAAELAAKLKPIVLGMDKGADKARLNRVEVIANGRQIDLLMASGCDESTPRRAVVGGTGTPLAALVARGVLVIRCNDARYQCLQSTRDPDDVLCTTAPRHK